MKKFNLFLFALVLIFSFSSIKVNAQFIAFAYFQNEDGLTILTEKLKMESLPNKHEFLSSSNFDFKNYVMKNHKNLVFSPKDFAENNHIYLTDNISEGDEFWDMLMRQKSTILISEFKLKNTSHSSLQNIKIE